MKWHLIIVVFLLLLIVVPLIDATTVVIFTTPGTVTWTVPANVNNFSYLGAGAGAVGTDRSVRTGQ